MSVANRLFFGIANIGGKISQNSTVKGYTEYRKDGCVNRSHPCYTQSGPWYDWGYFQWNGINKPIAGRLMIIFDLRPTPAKYQSFPPIFGPRPQNRLFTRVRRMHCVD